MRKTLLIIFLLSILPLFGQENDTLKSTPKFVTGSVDQIQVDTTTGSAWITIGGDSTEYTFDPPDYPIIIHDDEGNSYTIYPDGTVVNGTYFILSNDHLDVTAGQTVTFSQHNDENYGFDAKAHTEWHEQYEIIQLSDSSKYFVANKSLAINETDKVIAKVPSVHSNVTFQKENGDELAFSPFGGPVPTNSPGRAGGGSSDSSMVSYTVDIPKISSKGEHALYVYAGNTRIGKLNLHVFDEKEIDVVIVPIANVTLDSSNISAAVNGILGEASIKFNISTATQWNNADFTATTTIDLPSDVTNFNKYSDQMRNLRDVYFDSVPNADKSKYYLFVVDGFTGSANEEGYMVRGKGLGFVTKNATPQTYAHELGHGAGALEHTWKNNGPEEGTTDNLMDYSGGSNLTLGQWEELRKLKLVPSFWDGEEDAMYSATQLDYICIAPEASVYIDDKVYFNLDNEIISLASQYKPYAFVGSKGSDGDILPGRLAIIQNTQTGKLFYPRAGENKSGYCEFIPNVGLDLSNKYEPEISQVSPVIYINDPIDAKKYEVKEGNQILYSGVYNEIKECSGLPGKVYSEPKYFEKIELPNDIQSSVDKLDDSIYFAEFDQMKNDWIQELNGAVQSNQGSYNFEADISDDYTNFVHIIEVGSSDKSNRFFKKEFALLDQKLAYLKKYSSEQGEEIDFYIITGDVPIMMKGSDWDRFSKEIFEESNLSSKNAVLITIPHIHFYQTYQGFYFNTTQIDFDKTYYMASVHASASISEEFTNNKYEQANVTDFVFDCYRHTFKPFKVHVAFQEVDGSIAYGNEEKSDEYVSGYPFCCKNIFLYRKPQHDTIDNLTPNKSQTTGVGPTTTFYSSSSELLEYEIALAELMESAAQSEWVLYEPEDVSVLKENFIDDDHEEFIKYAFSNGFMQWSTDVYLLTQDLQFHDLPAGLTASHYYTRNTWDVLSPLVYGTLDAVGVGLSFVGLDVITDGIGLVIASSTGDIENVTAYTLALTIPAAGGLIVKQTINAASTAKVFFRGANYLLKNNQLVKINQSFKYGRVLTFFKLTDNNISTSEIQTFVQKFQQGNISNSSIKQIKNGATESERRVLFKDVASGAEGSLLSKLDNLGLSSLSAKLDDIGNIYKSKFLDEFSGASDEALIALNNRTDLVDYWKTNGDLIKNRTYPNVGHKPWTTTKQEILSNAAPSEIKILNAVENSPTPTNSQIAVAGAYSDELGGDVIIKYNNKNFDINLLEPELKQHIDYLQMIKNDFDDGGSLYQKLYSNVPPQKIQNAQDAGIHAEVLATNEVIKQLKMAGSFNGVEDLKKIEVLVKGRTVSFGNMCRCPHCFHITQGVKMIGNQ